MHTSGSTGAPKAVRILTKSLVNYMQCKPGIHAIGETSVVLVASAATFDPSLGDIFRCVYF
jgi:hypothetical protein